MANALGVEVDHSPKFHAEIAGEGIEYSWAHSKGSYRRSPLQRKRTRASFQALVKECTSNTNLTKNRVKRFSARARAYMCTYHFLHAGGNDNAGEERVATTGPLLLTEIEKMMKDFKTHRSAFDFDRGFLGACGGR